MILIRMFARMFYGISLVLLMIADSGCVGKVNGNIQFSKEPPPELSSSKILYVATSEKEKITLNSGTPPYTYSVELGDASVDTEGYLIAPDYLSSGNILVKDSEGKSIVVPYVIISKPLASVSQNLVTSSDLVPVRVVGGKGPYSYEIGSGSGSVDQDGIFTPAGVGTSTVIVTDSIGSKSAVIIGVNDSISVSNPIVVAGPSSTLNITPVNAVGVVSYQVVSGDGAVSESGVFTAPATNGTTIIKVTDSTGKVAYKEVSVTSGAGSPLRLQPTVIDIGVGQIAKLASSGGSGSNLFEIVANPSGAQIGQIGPGSLSTSTEVATFTAPSSISQMKETTVQVRDAGGTTAVAVVNIYPKLSSSVSKISLAASKSASFEISGGKAPYSVIADRGEATLASETVTYQAPMAEGTANIQVKDSLNQQIFVRVEVNPGLMIAPKKLALQNSKAVHFSGIGGKQPYTFKILNLDGQEVSDSDLYGSLDSEGLYQAPARNAELLVRVTDSESSTADSRVTIYGELAVSPSFAVTTESSEQVFTLTGGVAPYTATVLGDGVGGSVAEVSNGTWKYTAPTSISLQGLSRIKIVDSNNAETIAIVQVNKALAMTVSGASNGKFAVGNGASIAISGGVPPYVLSHSAQDILDLIQSSEAQGELSALKVGSSTITVTDSKSVTQSVVLTVVEPIAATPAQATIEVLAIQSFSLSGGVTPYQAAELLTGTGTLTHSAGSSTFTYQAGAAVESANIRIKDSLNNSFDIKVQSKDVNLNATLSGVPMGTNNVSSFNVTVGGAGISTYKYAVTSSITPCYLASGYSSTPIDVATPITGPIGGDGNIRLCVFGFNSNGVQQVTATFADWVKDTAPPTAGVNGAPTSVNNTEILNVTVSGSGVSHFKYKLVNGTSCPDISSEAEREVSYNIVDSVGSDGDKALCVIGRDLAGNYQSSATAVTWTKDTSGPLAVVSGHPTSSSNAVVLNIAVAGTDVVNYVYKVVEGSTCGADSGYSGAQNISVQIQDNITGKQDGSISICVKGLDAAGNFGSVVSHSWTKDVNAPMVSISNPTSASFVNSTSVGAFTVNGTCSEDGRAVNVIATGGLSSTPNCNSGAWTTSLNFTAVSDGAISITANHSDLAGNSATGATVNLNKDVVLPTLAFSAPAVNSYVSSTNKTAFSVSGTATDNVLLTFKVAGTDVGTASVSGGTWSTDLDFTSVGAEGSITVTATLVDEAGNANSGSRVFVKDTVPPTTPSAIVDGNYNKLTTATPTITFTGSTDTGGSGVQKYQARVVLGSDSNTTYSSWADFVSGASIASLTLADSTLYKVGIKAIDNAGNESSIAYGDGWTVDATAPTAPSNVDDGTSLTNLSGSPAITWSASSDSVSGISYYEVALGTSAGASNTASWTNVGNVTTYTFTGLSLTAGTYYATVRAIDTAGNISTAANGNGWNASSACTAGSQTFTFTGADQTFSVPAGCTQVTVKLWGAGGSGGYNGAGGGGGFAKGTLTGLSGETSLTVIVGKGGVYGSTTTTYGGGGAGGPNNDTNGGGSGGGRSAIRISGTEVITAGGGGGASYSGVGGAGGGVTAGNGTNAQCTGGGGGGPSSGGSGGIHQGSRAPGTNGVQFQGGNGGDGLSQGSWHLASGGGGGWYGGGGGGPSGNGSCAGGGGSSYTGGNGYAISSTVNTASPGTTAANNADANYVAGTANGGSNNTSGQNGVVVISW